MKILIQNGTSISGLAFSMTSKFKRKGFIKFEYADALHKDYLYWELAKKNKKDELVSLLKHIFGLNKLRSSSDAGIPAGFDILMIVSKNK